MTKALKHLLRLLTYRITVQAACMTCPAIDAPTESAADATHWAEHHALGNHGHTITITTTTTAAYAAEPRRP